MEFSSIVDMDYSTEKGADIICLENFHIPQNLSRHTVGAYDVSEDPLCSVILSSTWRSVETLQFPNVHSQKKRPLAHLFWEQP